MAESLLQKKNLRSDASKVEKRSFGTHDGTFHADEVTAGALLLVFNLIDNDKIYRTRCYEELSRCEFVCDVGGAYDSSLKLFDHHQAEYSGFLSSAGMILKYLRDESYIELAEYNHLNHFLVIGVDAHDNGKDLIPKGHCSFSHIISKNLDFQFITFFIGYRMIYTINFNYCIIIFFTVYKNPPAIY